MRLPLPPSIQAYFDAKTPATIAACFSEDAIVSDERRTYRGRAEIRQWREEVAKVSFEEDVIAVEDSGAHVKVTCQLTGSFPGSPVELDNRFTLKDGKIARLSIS